jgi:hypothetical protein
MSEKLRALALTANLSISARAAMNEAEFSDSEDKRREFRRTAPEAVLSLLDEIDRLTAELAVLEEVLHQTKAENADHCKAYELLFKKNAGLRKDAERYQWLCGFSSVTMPELTWGRRAGIPKNKLDAAIDAAAKEPT